MENLSEPGMSEAHDGKRDVEPEHQIKTTPPPKIPHAHRFIAAYILLIVGAIVVSSVYSWQHRKVNNLESTISAEQSQINKLQQRVKSLTAAPTPVTYPTDYSVGKKFSAVITADECATTHLPVGDVGCSITVSPAIQILVMHGNMAPQHPWGSFAYPTTNETGKTATIYAHQVDKSTYTLEGSSSYYVKIAD